jgi:hypothetical protein
LTGGDFIDERISLTAHCANRMAKDTMDYGLRPGEYIRQVVELYRKTPATIDRKVRYAERLLAERG